MASILTATRPPADRAAAFAEAKLPGRYAIGCFGRVRAQKGTDVFVEAMCRLLPRYPDFTAIIVGAVVPEQQGFANGLKQQIEAAGLQSRIVITGELAIEEVQRWYQRLTIYAFTSRNEGFGLTLIEAMSSGAALVAARAGAAEFVVEDGVTGVLTPPGDVEALVAALEPLKGPGLTEQMPQSGGFVQEQPIGAARRLFPGCRFFVQDCVQQSAVHLDLSVVANQSQLAKFVQEKAHPGPGHSDHLRQGCLID